MSESKGQPKSSSVIKRAIIIGYLHEDRNLEKVLPEIISGLPKENTSIGIEFPAKDFSVANSITIYTANLKTAKESLFGFVRDNKEGISWDTVKNLLSADDHHSEIHKIKFKKKENQERLSKIIGNMKNANVHLALLKAIETTSISCFGFDADVEVINRVGKKISKGNTSSSAGAARELTMVKEILKAKTPNVVVITGLGHVVTFKQCLVEAVGATVKSAGLVSTALKSSHADSLKEWILSEGGVVLDSDKTIQNKSYQQLQIFPRSPDNEIDSHLELNPSDTQPSIPASSSSSTTTSNIADNTKKEKIGERLTAPSSQPKQPVLSGNFIRFLKSPTQPVPADEKNQNNLLQATWKLLGELHEQDPEISDAYEEQLVEYEELDRVLTAEESAGLQTIHDQLQQKLQTLASKKPEEESSIQYNS